MVQVEKTAQTMNEIVLTLPEDANDLQAGDEIILEIDRPGEENDETVVFTLPNIPGADDDSEIVVDEPSELEVKEPESVEVEEANPWDWKSKGLGSFLGWLKEMMANVPKHSGRDVSGLERAISYFEALDREVSKAMREDLKGEIDAAGAESAREQIENGIQRMLDRLEKLKATKFKRGKKKKAWFEEEGLVKEAQKAERIGGIVITVPLFISRLARVCINGMVSGGHDIEYIFDKLNKKYKLSNREQAELMQLLSDMNYPVRRDRGFDLDEKCDPKSSDNYDWAANYPS